MVNQLSVEIIITPMEDAMGACKLFQTACNITYQLMCSNETFTEKGDIQTLMHTTHPSTPGSSVLSAPDAPS